MSKNTSQYIGLQQGENTAADIAEREYKPETRTVHLSGRCRRLINLRRDGIPILESGREQLTPLLDLKTLRKGLLYGLSSLLAVVGLILMIGKNKGELNGGNA